MYLSFVTTVILFSMGRAKIVMETDEPELPGVVVIKGEGTIVDPDKWTPFPTAAPVVTDPPTAYPTPGSPAPTKLMYHLWHLGSHDQCILDTGLTKDICLEAALLVGKEYNFPYYLEQMSNSTFPCGCFLLFNDKGQALVTYNANTPEAGGCATNSKTSLVCLIPPPTMAPTESESAEVEGRVEMYHDGQWGTICDDGFDIKDADVVCNQIGYNGAEEAYQSAYHGQGTGRIYLDDLACTGAEATLLSCPHSGINQHNCGHTEDAGVKCRVIPGNLRLVGGSTKNQGRVEMYYDGQWGTICDDDFDHMEADVVCNQIGYNGAEEAFLSAHHGQGSGRIYLDNLACTGAETTLLSCPHSGIGEHNCGHHEDAGVRCRLTSGALRLIA